MSMQTNIEGIQPKVNINMITRLDTMLARKDSSPTQVTNPATATHTTIKVQIAASMITEFFIR